MAIVQLELEKIRIDGGTQQRPLDEDAVAEYAERLLDGQEPPPINVVFDGKDYWPWDGFHRYHAKRRAKQKTIPANVTKGTLREAIWRSFSANKDQGVRRQRGVVKAIIEAIIADPEWGKTPHTKIASHVGATREYVCKIKAGGVKNGGASCERSQDAPEKRNVERGGKAYEMNVSRIGKPPDDSFFDDDPPKPTKDTRPKNGHVIAAVAKSAKGEPESPTDQEGNPLKRKDLVELFERRMELSEILRTLSAIKGQVQRHVKDKDELYRYLNENTFQVAIENVYRIVKFSLPYALCPYHADDPLAKRGCKCCGGAGWVPKDVHDQAPESMRKGAKR